MCVYMCVCVRVVRVSKAFAWLRYLTRRLINIEMTLGREVQHFTSGKRWKGGKPERGGRERRVKKMLKRVWMVVDKKSGEIRRKRMKRH